MDTLVRFVIALALIGLGVLLYQAWSGWQLRRLRRTPARPGLEGWQAGRPGILYFTSPDCAPCRTVQRPALAQLRAELGEAVQIIEIDASARTGVADHWGVLSVPTTFVLDAGGAPRHVNHGVARAEKLRQQLQSARAGGSGDNGPRAREMALDL